MVSKKRSTPNTKSKDASRSTVTKEKVEKQPEPVKTEPVEQAAAPAPSKAQIVQKVLLASSFIILAAVLSPVTEYNLSPVYGAIPTGLYHGKGTAVTIFLAFTVRALTKRFLRYDARKFLPIWAFYVPVIQWFMFDMSSKLGARLGPLLTEAVTYYPMLFLATLSARYLLDDVHFARFGTSAEGGPAIACTALFAFAEKAARDNLPSLMGSSSVFTRSGLQLSIASIFALMSPSPKLLLVAPAVLQLWYSSQLGLTDLGFSNLKTTLDVYDYSILDRRESITGYVSVLESQKKGIRFMRCDHSLLGGEWLVTAKSVERGQRKRESIYSVFTMLESVRLVETGNNRPDNEKNALFIGLGIGTSPSAFIQHGINTTIVEIDPAVHDFAIKYFDLPVSHHAAIQDAVPFVEQTSRSQPGSYDYIVHDVFTGGAEPAALFTFEFLSGLAQLLKEDGVIAINYAGDTTLPPVQLIVSTIRAVFPTCRIFRDTLPEDNKTTFINMVVFCVKQVNNPIKFRAATEDDWLGSILRQTWIPPKDELELRFAEFKGPEKYISEGLILKQGEEWRIEDHHPEAAIRHWEIMRTVLPDKIWENW